METTERDKAELPPPCPLAMVVCDYIHRDPGSGKMFILGCFSVIHAIEFPATHGVMCLYASVTDGYGKVPITVRLVDADEEREAIWEEQAEIEFIDPRMVLEMNFCLAGITFPEPGEYRFQLFASDQFLMERRIVVNELERQTDEPNSD